MTIQEAINSDKPFKRPHHDFWLVCFQGWVYIDTYKVPKWGQVIMRMLATKQKGMPWQIATVDATPIKSPPPLPTMISIESLLATDWEIKNGEEVRK